MADSLNHIIFKRLISLREEYEFTQRSFVEKFNAFNADKGIEISENRYTNIEKRLSTTCELLLSFINFYQEVYEIDPKWLLTPDNVLISKYVMYNTKEKEELEYLRNALGAVGSVIKDYNSKF